jgi:hypothetical protein
MIIIKLDNYIMWYYQTNNYQINKRWKLLLSQKNGSNFDIYDTIMEQNIQINLGSVHIGFCGARFCVSFLFHSWVNIYFED